LNQLTPVLKSHSLGKSCGITLETSNRLIVEFSDGLWEDVSGTGNTTLMSRNESGKERFRETGKNLELSSNGGVLETRSMLGSVLLGLGVNSESVALADLGTGQLFCQSYRNRRWSLAYLSTETIGVLGELDELIGR
jgi:hypothetical protein